MKFLHLIPVAFLIFSFGHIAPKHKEEKQFTVYYYTKVNHSIGMGTNVIFSEVKAARCEWIDDDYIGSSQRTQIALQFHDWFKARYKNNLEYNYTDNEVIHVFKDRLDAIKSLNKAITFYNNNKLVEYRIYYDNRFYYTCE